MVRKTTKRANKKVKETIEVKIKKGVDRKFKSCYSHKHSGGCFYFLGFLGALIYFISTATGFWGVVLGVLKSIVWPVFIIHGLLKFLGL